MTFPLRGINSGHNTMRARDIVNNSMRKIRPWVVQEAPRFELREFNRQLQTGTIRTMKTTYWLCQELPVCKNANPNYTPNDIFYTCFVALVRSWGSDPASLLPETLQMDKARIRTFYSSWEDMAVYANVLMVFKQALGAKAALVDAKEARQRLKIVLEDKGSTIENVHLEVVSLAGDTARETF